MITGYLTNRSQRVVVNLQNTTGNCQDGDIRLSDGEAVYEGRVELCLSGVWGTISDYKKYWSHWESVVVCRQLGYRFEGMSN